MNAGLVSCLVESAKKLYPDIEPRPVICLESDAWYVFLENTTWWQEGMNFMFNWQEQYWLDRYGSWHKNVKFMFDLTCNFLFIM